MTQQSRKWGAVLVLLLLGVVLSSCGTVPVAETWPGLTVDGDTVYAISASPQQVVMLNAETGQQKLSFVPQGQHRGVLYWSPVTVGEGVAYVGFSDPQGKSHGFYAFDPATGVEQWHIPTQDLILAAPTYTDGTVYFGSSDGRVYAVDAASKSVKAGWPFQAKNAVWASPLVAGGRVYISSMDHHLYCLDAETGSLVWDFQAGGSLAARPVLDTERGIVYVGSFDGHLYAVRADLGTAVEGFEFKAGNWIWSEVLLTGDRIYVTSLDGRLYGLDPASGAVQTPYPYDSKEIDDQKDAIRAAPTQAGDLILVATKNGRVIAVKNGVRQWYWPSGTPTASILTNPVVVGNRVYILLANGQVQTLQADNGVMGWGYTPPTTK